MQNPHGTNDDLSRQQGVPKSTKTMQDGPCLGEAMEVVESRVPGWAGSFDVVQRVGLGMG